MFAHGFEVNRSSSTGHCNAFSGIQTSRGSELRATCFTPNSSVLFDGEIPTLTGLDGNMWARQLLTMNTQTFSGLILDTYEISKVELVMFNSSEWGIGVSRISLRSTEVFPSVTSCELLVKVCIPCDDCDSTEILPDLLFYPTSGSTGYILPR